jgi:hypothetical protein
MITQACAARRGADQAYKQTATCIIVNVTDGDP